MTFHVVPISRERAHQLPVIESLLLEAAEKALLRNPGITILLCDKLSGPIAGFENYSKVVFLNDIAWSACRSIGLQEIGVVDKSEIPSPYVLLVGPTSEADPRDMFSE